MTVVISERYYIRTTSILYRQKKRKEEVGGNGYGFYIQSAVRKRVHLCFGFTWDLGLNVAVSTGDSVLWGHWTDRG